MKSDYNLKYLYSVPIIAANGSSMIFYFYSIICTLSILFIVRYIPEIKDKSLEEIESMWDRQGK